MVKCGRLLFEVGYVAASFAVGGAAAAAAYFWMNRNEMTGYAARLANADEGLGEAVSGLVGLVTMGGLLITRGLYCLYRRE